MYLVNINNRLPKNKALLFELIALILMILFGSVFGYISLLFYIFIVHRKYHTKLFKFELIFGTLIIIYFLNTSETLSRISTLFKYILTEFDIEKIASIEPSGSFRFYPVFFYLKNFDLLNSNYIFGFGPGASSIFFNEDLISSGFGLDLDSNFQGGFLPSFLIDYGSSISTSKETTPQTLFIIAIIIEPSLILNLDYSLGSVDIFGYILKIEA
jgi:hypothetical protein